jgi:hypothetical protein
MQQFDAVTVNHPQQRGFGQEELHQCPMRVEQAKQARAVWQVGKERTIVPRQPAPEGALTAAFQTVQDGQRHHFTRIQLGLTMFLLLVGLRQSVGNAAVQFCDKIYRGHEFVSLLYTLVGVAQFSTNS